MSSPERLPAPEGSWGRPEDSTVGGAGLEPARAPIAICRDCGRQIGWEGPLPSGRFRPIDPDGRLHFVTCPERARPLAKGRAR